jgi:hypothetical protein
MPTFVFDWLVTSVGSKVVVVHTTFGLGPPSRNSRIQAHRGIIQTGSELVIANDGNSFDGKKSRVYEGFRVKCELSTALSVSDRMRLVETTATERAPEGALLVAGIPGIGFNHSGTASRLPDRDSADCYLEPSTTGPIADRWWAA